MRSRRRARAIVVLVLRTQKLRLLGEIEAVMVCFEAGLGFATEKCHHVAHSEFTGGGLTLDGGVGELTLALLEVDDALLDGVLDYQFVDLDVKSLVETVDTVDGLFFDELD